MEELNVLLDSEQDTQSLNSSIIEMSSIYEKEVPYVSIKKTYGICYIWSDIFIEGLLLAMASDNLEQFTDDELSAWYSLVMFQDYHSHSPLDTDCNTLAIGCTIPNENFKSFVVCENGTITNVECQPPTYEVQDEEVWASLDRALIAMYNCEKIDNCNIDDTVEETVPCTI